MPVTIVLDTSALLFWSFDPASLTTAAQDAIDSSKAIVISSISLWEIALKHKRQRLHLPLKPAEYATELQRVSKIEIVSVSLETWLTNVGLIWDHADPADRTIVATAVERNCPLVSSDRHIREFYPHAIW